MAANGNFLSLPNSIEAINHNPKKNTTKVSSTTKTTTTTTKVIVHSKTFTNITANLPAVHFFYTDVESQQPIGENSKNIRRSSISSLKSTLQSAKRSVSLLFQLNKETQQASSCTQLNTEPTKFIIVDDLYARHRNNSTAEEGNYSSNRTKTFQVNSNADGSLLKSAKSERFSLFRNRKSMSMRKPNTKSADSSEHVSFKKSFKLFNSTKSAKSKNEESIEMSASETVPKTTPVTVDPGSSQPQQQPCSIIINECELAPTEDDPSIVKLMNENNNLSASTYSLNQSSESNNPPVSPLQMNMLASLEYLINQSKSSQLNFNTKLAIANIAAAMSPAETNLDTANLINTNANESDMILQSLLADLMIPPTAPVAANSQFDLNSTASNEALGPTTDLPALLYQQPQYLVNNNMAGFSLAAGINNQQINDQIMRTCMGYLDYINKKHTKERHIQKVRNKISGFVLLTLVFLMIVALCLVMFFFLTKTIIFTQVITSSSFYNRNASNNTTENSTRLTISIPIVDDNNTFSPYSLPIGYTTTESSTYAALYKDFKYTTHSFVFSPVTTTKTASTKAKASVSNQNRTISVTEDANSLEFLANTPPESKLFNRDFINKKLAKFIVMLYKELVSLKESQQFDYAAINNKIKILFIDMFNQLAIRFDLESIDQTNKYTIEIERLIDENSNSDSFDGFLNIS
jgi:hypothetical protein